VMTGHSVEFAPVISPTLCCSSCDSYSTCHGDAENAGAAGKRGCCVGGKHRSGKRRRRQRRVWKARPTI